MGLSIEALKAEGAQAHTRSGTEYGDGVKAYALAKHGPDGARFLDPHFQKQLLDITGEDVVDIGAGHAPWAIFAVEAGGARRVIALDIQKGMTFGARNAIEQAGQTDKIFVQRADAASLPYPDKRFRKALSINVGCNLPNTTVVGENGTQRQVGFGPHFLEMARVLEEAGRGIVTAPASFGEVFTSGTRSKAKVLKDIKVALQAIGDSEDPEVIKEHLNKLKDVHRATFARRNGQLVLITDESQLVSGEDIWRKLPGLTVPNRYHSEADYKKAFKAAGLRVRAVYRGRFKKSGKRGAYNRGRPPEQRLGSEYDGHHPFVVWILEKPVTKPIQQEKKNGVIFDAGYFQSEGIGL